MIPLEVVTSGKIMPYSTYTGNGGTLTVYGSGTRFYWKIALTVPADSFKGIVTGTDITTGFSICKTNNKF